MIVDNEFVMELLIERRFECSICVMFFSLALIVPIKILFLGSFLADILIKEFFILVLTLDH